MLHKSVLFVLLVVPLMHGCGTGDSEEEVATLQKQVAALTRQLEETRKQLEETRKQFEAMQAANQQLTNLLDSLETEIKQLKTREVPAPAQAPKPRAEVSSAVAPPPQPAEAVSCAQIWRQLGQGKRTAAVAQALGVPLEIVQRCEQKVGRGRAR